MHGDNTARNDKFHHSIIDRMTLVHVQPRPQVLKAATATKTDCELEGSWGIVPYSGKFSRGPNFRNFRDPRPKRENKNREI